MTDLPRVLVIQPDADDALERFEGWLTDAGLRLHTVRPYQEPLPEESDADALVVLGGRMSATRDDVTPWLVQIRVLMRMFAGRGRPVLGICLGGQLMAQAFGGEVAVGQAGLEVGLVRLDATAQAADDPLAAGLGPSFLSTSFHEDAITQLPERAVLLAGSAQYPHQMFRLDRCWGLQFHPETSPQTYEVWGSEVTPDTVEDAARVQAGAQDLRTHAEDVETAGQRIAEAFAAQVHLVHGSAD